MRGGLGGPAHGLQRTCGGLAGRGSPREPRPRPHPAHPSTEDRQCRPGPGAKRQVQGQRPLQRSHWPPGHTEKEIPPSATNHQPPQSKKHSRPQLSIPRSLVPKPGGSKHCEPPRLSQTGLRPGGGTGRRRAGPRPPKPQPWPAGLAPVPLPRPRGKAGADAPLGTLPTTRTRLSGWLLSAESWAPVCCTAASRWGPGLGTSAAARRTPGPPL